MNVKKIIAVVPVYNNPKTIKAVVCDIVAHNYKVIVVDDGSDVMVENLLDMDNENIIIVRHSVNKGKRSSHYKWSSKSKRVGIYTHSHS